MLLFPEFRLMGMTFRSLRRRWLFNYSMQSMLRTQSESQFFLHVSISLIMTIAMRTRRRIPLFSVTHQTVPLLEY